MAAGLYNTSLNTGGWNLPGSRFDISVQGLDLYCAGRKFSLLFNTLRTGDADLRFYITTVQDG